MNSKVCPYNSNLKVVSVLINYVSIIVDIVTPSVVMTISAIVTIPNSSWVKENENGSDTTSESGDVNLFINGQGLLLAFNPIVKLFKKSQRI
jgi:DNA-directed RNA polymerase